MLVVFLHAISRNQLGYQRNQKYRKSVVAFLSKLRAHPNLVASCFGIFLVVALFGGVETAARLWFHLSNPPPPLETRSVPAMQRTRMGMEYPPGSTVLQEKSRSGKPVMRSVYTIDDKGFRVTPVTNREDRHKFVAFFADSIAFGEGVADDETLPAYTGRMAEGWMPYNFGCPAHGPQRMHMQLVANRPQASIAESSGVGIYLFIDDHVYRATGSLRLFNLWCSTSPCYEIQNGTLQFRGSFEEARPFRNSVYRLLWRSHAVRNFGFEWPPVGEKTLELTATIIGESKKLFERSFPGSRFVVIMYPDLSTKVGPRLGKRLRQDGIVCCEFPGIFSPGDWDSALPDGHPSAAMHEILAKALSERLGLSN